MQHTCLNGKTNIGLGYHLGPNCWCVTGWSAGLRKISVALSVFIEDNVILPRRRHNIWSCNEHVALGWLGCGVLANVGNLYTDR